MLLFYRRLIFPCLMGLFLLHPLLSEWLSFKEQPTITYDRQSLLINGTRRLILAGALHYPRTPATLLPNILEKMKKSSLNTVDAYVFWNLHEQRPGEIDFEVEGANLIYFLEQVKKANLYLILRIGPYICAEWGLGGLPLWMMDSGISTRTWHPQFMSYMERFVEKVIQAIQPYLFNHGGPIILFQIENEYNYIRWATQYQGKAYIRWVSELTERVSKQVPWIMCYQDDQKNVINTCNGFYCHEWISQHRKRFIDQPAFFTELWTGWFQGWSQPKPTRPAQDIALSILRFISHGGSLVSYYMWFGGTNLHRWSGSMMTTSYDYDAPINEYGFLNQPKAELLGKLNAILLKYEQALLHSSKPRYYKISNACTVRYFSHLETTIYFLDNANTENSCELDLLGHKLILPPWSAAILSEKSGNGLIEFKTFEIISESNPPLMTSFPLHHVGWKKEPIGFVNNAHPVNVTDYIWYECSNIPKSTVVEGNLLLTMDSMEDVAHVWLDEQSAPRTALGIHIQPNSSDFVSLSTTNITFAQFKMPEKLVILVSVTGYRHFGPLLERNIKGRINNVHLNGVNLSHCLWKVRKGLIGEEKQYMHRPLSIDWNYSNLPFSESSIWYKAQINKDIGSEPHTAYAIRLNSMGRGQIWINGHFVGRYWNIKSPKGYCHKCNPVGRFEPYKCLTKCGEESQSLYHVPKDYLQDVKVHQVVIYEEIGGNISGVEFIEILEQ